MKKHFTILILSIIAFLFVIGCAGSGAATATESRQITFEDMNKSGFFPTGKLSYVIQGMMVSGDMSFNNYLEGSVYTAKPNGSDVVLKGTVNELWRTSLERVLTTYTKEDGSPLSAEDFKPDTYINLKTKAEGGYFACFAPLNTRVEVQTAWGDVLIANRPEVPHGDGDYILCRAGADGKPDFSDVWVVNGAVFPLTYDMSQKKK